MPFVKDEPGRSCWTPLTSHGKHIFKLLCNRERREKAWAVSFQHHGQTVSSARRGNSFVFVCSCHVFLQKLFSAVKLHRDKLFGVFFLFKQAACQRAMLTYLCLCTLAQPDTILLRPNGKHSQHIACFVSPDGKIKAKLNSLSSAVSGSMVRPPKGKSSHSYVIGSHYRWSPARALLLCLLGSALSCQ